MPEIITGRIVKILDESHIVANFGLRDGVSNGDRFVVFEAGEEITDPETGESLGELELVKAHIEAVHVQDRMTLLTPFAVVSGQRETATVLSAVMARTSTKNTPAERAPLTVRTDQVSGIPVIRPVQVGDCIRRIS